MELPLSQNISNNNTSIDKPLLSIKDFSLTFNLENGTLKALENINFDIAPSSIVNIVGESGSGKSSVGLSMLRLNEARNSEYSGSICFEDKNVLEYSQKELESFRGKTVSMIFQEPMNALNPVMKVGKQVEEALLVHNICSQKEAASLVVDMFNEVGISNAEERVHSYPHELSGGMRQRVMIAMAVITKPKLIIADEPTTSLDITISKQILALIKRMHDKHNISIIFISHDLSLIETMSDYTVVMYLGHVVENAKTSDIIKKPLHPYTKALFSIANHIRERSSGRQLPVIGGEIASAINKPTGCVFHPRCKECMPICREVVPTEKTIGSTKVSCHKLSLT